MVIQHGLLGGRQTATAVGFRQDYETLVAGFRSAPLPLPGSPYWHARAAQRRLIKKIEGFVLRRVFLVLCRILHCRILHQAFFLLVI